jgi:hypothetical protein
MTASAVEQEIRHLHDLLFLRDLLADRGVTPEELQRYDTAIAAARRRLAEVVRAASAGLAA